MALDPRTPVLVGIASIEQRLDDATEALEPVELMIAAAEAAADDAGSRRLLHEADAVRVPRGFWEYPDPGRLVAERIAAPRARTLLAELGILQQTLISDACRAIAEGREDVSVLVGGESKFRSLRARISGAPVHETQQSGVSPDEKLEPKEPLFGDLEAARGLIMPVRAFALIDNALRAHDGISVDEHRDELARLWADFSKIAGSNPHAWRRTTVSFEDIRNPTPANRMIAFPYTKLLNSEWNVDQAAGLIFCSVARAQALGIPSERWVFPHAASESGHVVSLAARKHLHRSPNAKAAGERALELAERTLDRIDHLELYSCFPAAVRVFARELGIDEGRPLTVTGGMAFAGGPLNNYVLQATVRMAELLRDDPSSTGLVSCVSGFINKAGFGIWSGSPPANLFRCQDVTEAAAADSEECEVEPDYTGPARVASYTVAYAGDDPFEGIAVCDLPDGRRTIAISRERNVAEAMTREEFCGRDVEISEAGVLAGR